MGKELYTAKQFIDAIPGTGGIVDTIAKRVGCTWHTAKKYIDSYATIQKAYQDETERVSDLAHTVVIKAINDGDVATAKWYLTKKRKAEFGEALDITTAGQPITIVNWDEDAEDNSD